MIMKLYIYKIKVGRTYYRVRYTNEVIEKIFNYYKIPFEKTIEDVMKIWKKNLKIY